MGYRKALTYYGMGADDASLEIEVDESGGLTPADFNSTKFPGVCKPTNQKALDKILEYQRQLNRLAHQKGFAKIAVDGDVGPATLQLLGKVSPANAGSSCLNAAVSADMMTPIFKQQADAAGVPATVAGPRPATPPSYITPTGTVIKGSVLSSSGAGASLIDAFGSMSPGQKVLAAALLGGIGYFGYKELKKGKK